jgi:hypothetical protein
LFYYDEIIISYHDNFISRTIFFSLFNGTAMGARDKSRKRLPPPNTGEVRLGQSGRANP